MADLESTVKALEKRVQALETKLAELQKTVTKNDDNMHYITDMHNKRLSKIENDK